MSKSKHGQAVEDALGEDPNPSAGVDAFTLSEDDLALVNLFDDTSVEQPTPSTTEEVVPEEEAARKVASDFDEEDDEPKAEMKPKAAESPAPDKLDEETPPVSLDLPSEKTQEPPKKMSPEDQAKLDEQRAQWRNETLSKLEQHYATQLSDEDRDLLLTEPERVLPKLLARSYMDVYDSLMVGMSKQMPTQVTQLMEQQKQAAKAEEAFFGRWPKLKEAALADKSKADILRRTVQTYRQVNPNATPEQAIAEAGAMAMVALQIPLEADDKAAAPKDEDKPFTPATPGGGSRVAPPPAPRELNEYEKLAEELLHDEDM